MNTNPQWEKETLQKLLFETINEQKSKRRWGIFFKLIFLAYAVAFLWAIWPGNTSLTSITKPHVAVVDIKGQIDADDPANADDIISSLDKAFKDKNTQAVILDINSPGGSAVQAADVFDEIMRLRQLHQNIKVYAVCSDACASAAYYMASAANDIYANQASLVGSIGVMLDGFGFTGTMDKVGVERRLMTAGDHKGFMDPFSPMSPDDEKIAQGLLDGVHTQFIQSVERGRGNRLKITPDTFSGLVWTGQQALPLGLIDGFGTTHSVARDIIKNTSLIDYTTKQSVLDQFSNKFGASIATRLGAELGIGSTSVRAQDN